MALININKVKKQNTTTYPIINMQITVGGNAASTTYTGDFDAAINDSIQITGSLQGGSLINYGTAILKLPIVRYAGGKVTDDEIYFNATVVDGVINAQGSFPRSGKWSLVTKRVNESIDSAGNGWYLSHKRVNFLVS